MASSRKWRPLLRAGFRKTRKTLTNLSAAASCYFYNVDPYLASFFGATAAAGHYFWREDFDTSRNELHDCLKETMGPCMLSHVKKSIYIYAKQEKKYDR